MGTTKNNQLSVCEEKNYNRLYMLHATSIRNFIYYKCGSLSKAEDFTHEAFLKLWKNCKEVVFEKAKSFLFTVSNRLFLNDYNHGKIVLSFEKKAKTTDIPETPQFIMEEDEFKQKLESAISSLSEAQREVFLMNRIDKIPFKEIADLLDISVKAVEKRMHKALQNLKNQVEELNTHKI